MPVDSYIAATAKRHHLTIVTGNDKDFRRAGIKAFNPFKVLPPIGWFPPGAGEMTRTINRK